MTRETKQKVNFEVFDSLEFRLGKIIGIEPATSNGKPAYRFKIDFGKFGERISIGRFTKHPQQELLGRMVVGVLNMGEREIDNVLSQALILGLQFPSSESGEATPLVPLQAGVKIGGRVF